MLKRSLVSVLLFFSVPSVFAINLKPDGMSASYGQYLPVVSGREASYHNYRLSLVWDWEQNVYQSDSVNFGGYFELAGGVWKSRLSSSDNLSPEGKKKANIISLSPVFRISSVKPNIGSMVPFIDLGAGVAWLSETDLEKKKKSPINMGGHWQFELRLMAGVLFGDKQQYEMRYGWLHYSNAHINALNESIDFHVATFGWRW